MRPLVARFGVSSLASLALVMGCAAAGDDSPVEIPLGVAGTTGSGGSGPDTVSPGTGGSDGVAPGGGGGAMATCASSEAGLPGLRRLTRRELEHSLRDVFPSLGAEWSSGMSGDSVSSANGFDNDNELLVVSKQTAREVATAAEAVGVSVSASLAQLLPCAATGDRACAEQFLSAQGRRLFRRPLSAAEQTQFLDFWNTAFTATGDFAQSMGWLTRALIESPEFMYRRELGTPSGDRLQLNQYEIATELAYTFSGTGPNDALLDRAEAGELSSPEVLVQTAHDLLMTAGREQVQSFFDAFVGYARITTIAKAGVDGFAERRAEMLEETRHFIDEVVFARGGGGRELLTANFTTPSVALANFYKFNEAGVVPASDYAVVQRPAGQGIGLLAQGAVLATLAQPNGSSPTKRGLWVYKHLLCNEVPPVPPNIPELQAPVPGARTTRQRYEQDHAGNDYCRGCHGRWDPIGFGFEHFDEAGRYRDIDNTFPVDAKSHVAQGGETLFEFDGQEDLMTQLVEEPLVHECMSGYLATYAFGETVSCGGETRRADFINGTIGFVDYLASLAGEPHFSQRRTE
ncbi:MAG TPA: DUF1588 domain-containing protein [Polyangiaceae bacterium]|nr:DUF1588 domain-containing protein [Polyangiaceae bacterium]